tara:strand:- start:1893 stop:2558 length:666 start_codon:yes stop_codon:yes gene_type:complete
MKIVALLPMKANSERVKNKNFRIFGTKPLYKWILDTLLKIDEIDLIVINTDARNLLEEHGTLETDRVIIRDRKEVLCGDFVSMNLVVEDDINNIKADTYIQTHTTNPFLSSNTISNALNTFKEINSKEKYDSLFSVEALQERLYTPYGEPINHDPNNLIRTQDLEKIFIENSNFYIFTQQSFKASKARIGHKPFLFETPALESLDIDTPTDWKVAEAIAKS